jgi:predicted ester cyclase
MSVEENKAVVRRYYEEMGNQRNLAVADELFAPDFRLFPDSPPPHGPEGVKAFITWLCITAFPDLRVTVEEMVAEGDTVAARAVLHATQTAPIDWFPEVGVIPPTGQAFDYTEVHFWRCRGGRIVGRSVMFDNLGLLRQLGAFARPHRVEGATTP